jgi:8-oxo-dGTP pyrophosphatase MutT (NUDIX family)
VLVTQCLEVAAVCFVDPGGRLLTVRKRGTQAFMLPGGKLEPAEAPLAAAVREVVEELGVACDPRRLGLLGRWQVDAANEPGIRLDAHVFVSPERITPSASGEIDELAWIPLDGGPAGRRTLAPLLVDRVLPALRAAP